MRRNCISVRLKVVDDLRRGFDQIDQRGQRCPSRRHSPRGYLRPFFSEGSAGRLVLGFFGAVRTRIRGTVPCVHSGARPGGSFHSWRGQRRRMHSSSVARGERHQYIRFRRLNLASNISGQRSWTSKMTRTPRSLKGHATAKIRSGGLHMWMSLKRCLRQAFQARRVSPQRRSRIQG